MNVNNNILISLNYKNLHNMIDNILIENKNINKNNIFIKYVMKLEEYEYNKIVNELDNNDIKFNTIQYLISNNYNDILIELFFENNKIIDILNNYKTINLPLNIKSSKKVIYNTLSIINDRLFNIYIYEKIDLNDNNINLQWIIKSKEEIKIKNNYSLNAINNDEFNFEYFSSLKELSSKNDNIIKEIIEYKYTKNYIIEDDKIKDIILNKINKTSYIKFRQTINLLLEDLIEKIDINYCVFEKTDGLRTHLILINNDLYYMDMNNNLYFVKSIDNTNKHFFIMDAEYYENKFYIFNLLYFDNINIPTKSLKEKLDLCKNVITTLNINDIILIKSPIFFTDNKKETFFKNVYDFYINIKNKKEIKIDGLIYQPILSDNNIKELDLKDYKWKPADETTIDFYVVFSKNDNFIKNKDGVYLKMDLYGFDVIQNVNKNSDEEMVEKIKYVTSCLIKSETIINDEYENYVFKTLNNELIISDIVIEFTPLFLNPVESDDDLIIQTIIENNINWVPLRIRNDKTEQVKLYNRKHGNNYEIIKQLLDYINNPINLDYYYLLSENFNEGYDKLQGLLVNKKIYTKVNTVENKLLDFIKTSILTTTARYIALNKDINFKNRTIEMVEFNCGNGRDLLKMYLFGVYLQANNRIFYTGFNTNKIELISNINGAISRYNNFRSNQNKYPNFFPFNFIYETNFNNILNNKDYRNRFNLLFCFNFFIYQNSYQYLEQMKKIFDYVLEKDSYLFLIIYTKKNTIYNSNYINKDLDDVVKILKYTVLYNIKFIDLYNQLLLYRNLTSIMTNKETAKFLNEVINAFESKNFTYDENINFIILKKY